ncbi:hypothetical protein EDC01DRAFT_630787 [Geopyxis carbonaria]|nr:hypothetical protein EDC01DRAFT_630787 [Geopyxis carbonaria]
MYDQSARFDSMNTRHIPHPCLRLGITTIDHTRSLPQSLCCRAYDKQLFKENIHATIAESLINLVIATAANQYLQYCGVSTAIQRLTHDSPYWSRNIAVPGPKLTIDEPTTTMPKIQIWRIQPPYGTMPLLKVVMRDMCAILPNEAVTELQVFLLEHFKTAPSRNIQTMEQKNALAWELSNLDLPVSAEHVEVLCRNAVLFWWFLLCVRRQALGILQRKKYQEQGESSDPGDSEKMPAD